MIAEFQNAHQVAPVISEVKIKLKLFLNSIS